MFVIQVASVIFIFVNQKKFTCCGGFNYTDWKTVPASCCANAILPCTNPYPVGCGEAIFEVFRPYLISMGIVSLVMAILEIVAVFSACILAKKSDQSKTSI
uniref:Tetraspanin n=1 Tax=Mesocestoides corti TaxID=53468 RepID=A0A5K3FIP6_MESCO